MCGSGVFGRTGRRLVSASGSTLDDAERLLARTPPSSRLMSACDDRVCFTMVRRSGRPSAIEGEAGATCDAFETCRAPLRKRPNDSLKRLS